MNVPAAVVLAFLGVAAQATPPPVPRAPQQPPRDAVGRAEPAGPAGTGVIKGRVVTADTGNPIRRANVSLCLVPTTARPRRRRTSGDDGPGIAGVGRGGSDVGGHVHGQTPPGDDRLAGGL